MAKALAEIFIVCLVWAVGRVFTVKQREIKNFCSGFCIAQAVSGLCGRCAWLYSVVFGELIGFIMLAVTVICSVLLFGMLWSRRSGTVLTAVYLLFSCGDGEYAAGDAPILNTVAHGLGIGIIGASEENFKSLVLMLASFAIGQLLCVNGTVMPASFGAVSCCALLCRGMWGIDDNTNMKLCCAGAVGACLLAYF